MKIKTIIIIILSILLIANLFYSYNLFVQKSNTEYALQICSADFMFYEKLVEQQDECIYKLTNISNTFILCNQIIDESFFEK